jgi:hypothetical protein
MTVLRVTKEIPRFILAKGFQAQHGTRFREDDGFEGGEGNTALHLA